MRWSAASIDDPAIAQRDRLVGERRELGVVGDEHEGAAALAVDGDQQIDDLAAGFGTVDLNSFAPNNIGGPFTQPTFTFDPKMPSYNLLNLRVGMLRANYDIALFVNNITDERALLALDRERGTRARVGYLTNQPRTFGISASFQR